jgi:hypothetical protein
MDPHEVEWLAQVRDRPGGQIEYERLTRGRYRHRARLRDGKISPEFVSRVTRLLGVDVTAAFDQGRASTALHVMIGDPFLPGNAH